MKVRTINYILSLPPGRELNDWVNNLVFDGEGPCTWVYGNKIPLHYSSNMDDTMAVEEEMHRKNYRFALTHSQHRPHHLPPWRASFCKWGGKANRWFCDGIAAEAICKAAIIAIYNEKVPAEERYVQTWPDDQSLV